MTRKLILFVFLIIGITNVSAMELEKSTSEIKPFVNLSDPQVLRPLLSKKFRKEPFLSKAVAIVKSRYEVAPRAIESKGANSKFGLAFCASPEILAYTMEICKGKTVLELGGADGPFSILFAYAGAERVYMNDIEPLEIAKFETRKRENPDVEGRLVSVCCSALDILKKQPELASKIDVVFSNNLIHFFTDKQLALFFPILKKLLKPNAQIIFSTNCLNFNDAPTFSNATRLTTHTLYIHNLEKHPEEPIKSISLGKSICHEDLDPLVYEKKAVFAKIKETGFKWQALRDAQTIARALKNVIDVAMKEERDLIKTINDGYVVYHSSTHRLFTPDTLTKLFTSQGFVVNVSFYLAPNGHLIMEPSSTNPGQQVFVIGTYQPNLM